MSNYLREVLGAEKTFLNPNQPQGLVADIGPDIPGGEGANEGFWREQIRDRIGRFAKMFGNVLFDIEIEGLGRITGHGEIVEMVRPQVALVRVKNHKVLPDGDYEIPGEDLEGIDGLIKDADYERVTGKTLPKSESPELKDEITGDEAMQVVRNAGAEYAKSQGRFPMSRTYDDVRQGLRAQYMQFLDGIKKDNPELLKNQFIINEDGTGRVGDIETEDDFWGAITAMQVSTTSRWVSPDNINPLAKEVNRRYAEKFLGVKKDGLISFYRNVIQEKEDPADAAAGYASLDRKMAWDYNPDARPGDVLRGRYIVKAKPDEVLGILGYSGALDEFGVVISPEVTSLPGRFERVGDLEKQRIDGAPWVDYEELDKLSRFGGGSPFRFLAPMTNFDYYALDSSPFGEGDGWASFYEANGGLQQGAMPNKYNELYGEGAWEKDFGTGSPRASQFANLFIKFTDKDGKEKWGLDAPKLRELSSIDMLNNAESGDEFDRNIKVLSTMQELMGKPFFVNKGHDQSDPRIPDEPTQINNPPAELDKKEFKGSELLDSAIKNNEINYDALPESTLTASFDRKDIPKEQDEAISVYSGSEFLDINAYLRADEVSILTNKDYLDNHIKNLDALIDEKGDVLEETKVYRGTNSMVDSGTHRMLDALQEGDIVEDPAYSSTTKNSKIAFSNFGLYSKIYDSDSMQRKVDAKTKNGGNSSFWAITLPVGSKALAKPEGQYPHSHEKEILLPRGSKYKINGIRKIAQIDENGNETGSFNYFIDATVVPDLTVETKESEQSGIEVPGGDVEFFDDSESTKEEKNKDVYEVKPKVLETDVTTGDVNDLQNTFAIMWTGNDWYKVVNKYLRFPEEITEEDRKQLPDIELVADQLTQATKNNKFKKDQVLLRRVGLRSENLKVGDIVEDAGFQATTKSSKIGTNVGILYEPFDENFTDYKIYAKKGQPGLDLEKASFGAASSEQEVLLPPGTKFRVLSVSEVPHRIEGKKGNTLVEVEIISTEDTTDQDFIDFSSFEKVSDRLGSNPGGIYKDPKTSKQYYVKIQDNKRGENEQLASALYREAGLDALEVKSGTLNGDNVTFTDWRDEKLDSVYGKMSSSDPINPDDPAFDGFAIDAWLANWDVVGTGYDNLSFDKDGNPVRLDSGGSLLYRARGDRKGEAFGNEVGELETFKSPSNTTGELFRSMGADAEIKSIDKLRKITPERIDELVDQYVSDPDDNKELKDKLKARREFILSKYDQGESSSEKEEPDATPETTSIDNLGIDFQTATMDADGTRLPTPGAFTGKFQEIMEGAKDWKEVQDRLKGQTVTYFDFETSGISDYDGDGIKNDPIQLGAVQVKDGKVIKRFNVYTNPGSKLSEWSADNLKRDVVDENGKRVLDENGNPASTLVTPDWLENQMSPEEGLRQFIEFMGPGALLGGQNVPFDVEILKRMADSAGIELDIAGTIDSKDLASLLPKYDAEKGIDGPKQLVDKETGQMRASSSLGPVANFLGFEPANWHSADGDAEDSYNLVSKIIDRAASEDNKNLRLLDFPEMEKEYKEKMDAFKAAVSPDNPPTERQIKALTEFAETSDEAKKTLATVKTRGEAAEVLEKLNSASPTDDWEPKEGLTTGKGESKLLDTLVDGDYLDIDSMEDGDVPRNFEKSDLSDEQDSALRNYASGQYRRYNNLLRYGPEDMDPEKAKDIQEKINNLDKVIDTYGDIYNETFVFRGMTELPKIEDTDVTMTEMLENLNPGDIFSDPGYTSTSSNRDIALRQFGPGMGIDSGETVKASEGSMRNSSFWTVRLPPGSKALGIPQAGYGYASSEDEVIIPRDAKLKINGIRKVPQIDEDGNENGNFNYYVEATVQPEPTNEEPTSTSKIDTTGTRLSSDSREGLDSLISNFNLIDNEASSQAYRDVASELGRPISLPWDDERTPEGRETYEYIYSAKRFKKTIPENSEEAELIRIKNLFKENLDNNKDLQEAKKTLASNKLYKDLSDALNSEINDFDEDDISFALMDVGRNLSRPRPRLSDSEIEEFLIESPDYADEEVNNLTYDVTVDVDQSVEITNKDLKEFSETAAVSVILPTRALEEVLNEGRMKTVHETKYSQAGNHSEEYRALRVAYESLAFGYGGDSPMEERPVYGLLRSAELPMPEDALMIYGGGKPAQIVLKPEAKERTTISDRDSLNNFEPTTPLSDPKFEASHLTRMAAVYREATGENFFETENFAKYGSIEAQVHGGVKLEDIGKVLFYETPSEEIRELLTSKGIIWEVSRSKPYSKPRSFGGGMF